MKFITLPQEKLVFDYYWKCPTCGYYAFDEQDKKNHLKTTMEDGAHIEMRLKSFGGF